MSGSNISSGSLSHSPLKQQGLPIQDVEHAECDPPKWLTVSSQCLCEMGNCAAHAASKATLTYAALKQQADLFSLTLLCQLWLRSLPWCEGPPSFSNEPFLFRR